MIRTCRTLVAAACLLVLCVASGSPADAAGTGRPTKVLILGDSVMLGALTRYPVHLPGRDLTVDAMVNRSTGQGADVVATRGSDWDIVVVLLGHNDAGYPGAYEPAANRILSQLAGVPRVAWLTLHESRPTFAQVNRFLRTLPPTHPNLWIADWNRTVSQHPDATSSDGLHLRGPGPDLMAGFVADIVKAQEYLAANPPTTTTLPPPTTTSQRSTPTATEAGAGSATGRSSSSTSSGNDEGTRIAEFALLGAFVLGCGVWVVRRSRHRDPRLR